VLGFYDQEVYRYIFREIELMIPEKSYEIMLIS